MKFLDNVCITSISVGLSRSTHAPKASCGMVLTVAVVTADGAMQGVDGRLVVLAGTGKSASIWSFGRAAPLVDGVGAAAAVTGATDDGTGSDAGWNRSARRPGTRGKYH